MRIFAFCIFTGPSLLGQASESALRRGPALPLAIRDITPPITENQMEQNIENDWELGHTGLAGC